MSSYRLQRMDVATWLPTSEVTGVASASISRDANRDGSSPLMQSASIQVNGKVEEGYYRLAEVDGATSTELATLLLIPDSSEYAYGTWETSASGKSVLAHASELTFAPGAYVPMSTDVIAWAAKLLSEDIPAPVVGEGSFRLAEHFVFDLGQTHLDGIWGVLDVAGYTMSIAGDGTVTIHPRPAEPALTVTTANRGVIGCEISSALPIADVPNKMKVYVDGKLYVATNDDPESPTSTVSRERDIEAIEEDPQRKDGEPPLQYAMRRLSELSEVWETYDVTRKWVDGVVENSLVRVNLPEQGIEGDFVVMSQDVDCEGDVFVSETWGRLA